MLQIRLPLWTQAADQLSCNHFASIGADAAIVEAGDKKDFDAGHPTPYQVVWWG